MKKIIYFLFTLGVLTFSLSCTSQSGLSEETVDSLVNSEEFTFMGEKAEPVGADVMNVLRRSQNYQVLDLTLGDGIVFKKEVTQVHLPYFGRVFTPSYDPTKSGFIFESKDFELNKIKNSDGKWIVRFMPKDQNHIRYMQLEVFKNGRAYLSVDASDRQAINYSGYITQNEATK